MLSSYATNLASAQPGGEVIDGICAQIDHPEIHALPELMQFIKGPDFPVSCEIRGIRGIEEYFRTGRGSMRLRGKVEIEENESGRSFIIIREVPYGVNRAVLGNVSPNWSARRPSREVSPGYAATFFRRGKPASRSS